MSHISSSAEADNCAAEQANTACIGCRLRRKKCDKQSPCSTCKELQIPKELCIYRRIGLVSKDSNATYVKEVQRNRELKDEVSRLKSIVNYNNTATQKEYFFSNNNDKVRHILLNPQKNPLLCTVMSSQQSLAYLGSISVAAVTQSEPRMKMMLQNIHTVIMNAKIKLEKQVPVTLSNSPMLEIFNAECQSQYLAMGHQNDSTIINLIGEIETMFPTFDTFTHAMVSIFRTTTDRWILIPYADEATFYKRFYSIASFDPMGNVHFHIDLQNSPGDLNFLAMTMSMLCICAFAYQQTKFPIGLDYMLYSKYVNALLRIDGQNIKFTEVDVTYERVFTLYLLSLLETYTTSGGFLNSFEEICEGIFKMRNLITMAISIHLHEDLDKWYPQTSPGEKRMMKTLWYCLVLFETFESIDLGFISKIEPSTLKRYDSCCNPLTEGIHMLNGVMFSYNMIDDGPLDQFIDFVETELIRRLKNHLKDEFGPAYIDMQKFQQFDLDDLSEENLSAYSLILQRLAMRFLILGVILTLYHICHKRLEQVGDTHTDHSRRLKLLGWKYSLTIENLLKEMWIGYSRIGKHPAFYRFYPTTSLIMMAPILRFSQRRVTLFTIAKLLNTMNVDENLIANHILYGDNRGITALLKDLKEKGQAPNLFSLEQLENMDVDNNFEQLLENFGSLENVHTIVLNIAITTLDILQSMQSKLTSFNFLKLSKIFHVVLLKLCGFLLHNTSLKIEHQDFDFKEFFNTGDVTDDDLLEVFKMTAQSKFW